MPTPGGLTPPLPGILSERVRALGTPKTWGEGPIEHVRLPWYRDTMNLIVLIIVLMLLFGGGGFYIGGPAFGGGGLGLVLLICLIIYLMGGFRTKN